MIEMVTMEALDRKTLRICACTYVRSGGGRWKPWDALLQTTSGITGVSRNPCNLSAI